MGTEREQRLETAMRTLLRNIPQLWGDDVVNNEVAIVVDADALERAQRLLSTPPEATPEPPTPEPERPAERCVWREDPDERGWQATCGGAADALDKRWQFCPHCGKPLSVEEDTQ